MGRNPRSRASTPPRAASWVIAGLVLMFAGPSVNMLLIDHAAMRATGAPAFGLMSAGVVLGAFGAWVDRRIWVRLLCAVNFVLLALFAYMFFVLAELPKAQLLAKMELAPDFTLPDHTGKQVSLSEARATGPVLLVFFRGHW